MLKYLIAAAVLVPPALAQAHVGHDHGTATAGALHTLYYGGWVALGIGVFALARRFRRR